MKKFKDLMEKFDLDDRDLPLAIIYVTEDDESIGLALPFTSEQMTDEDREIIQGALNTIADRIVDIFDRLNK